MGKKKKIIGLVGLLAAILVALNLDPIMSTLGGLYAGGQMLGIVIVIVLLGLAAIFLPWGEWLLKARMARRITGTKWIPQPKRIEIGRQWCENQWKTLTFNKSVVLADNYITPRRDDAHPIEMMLFTTSKAFAEQRIDVSGIPENQRFYVFVDCINGECFSMAYMNKILTENAVQFINRHWYMSIKQRVETPIEKKMKEAFAVAQGMELGKRDLEESEDKKEEKVKA